MNDELNNSNMNNTYNTNVNDNAISNTNMNNNIQNTATNNTNENEKASKKTGIFIGIIVVLLIIIGVCVYFLFFKDNKPVENNPNNIVDDNQTDEAEREDNEQINDEDNSDIYYEEEKKQDEFEINNNYYYVKLSEDNDIQENFWNKAFAPGEPNSKGNKIEYSKTFTFALDSKNIDVQVSYSVINDYSEYGSVGPVNATEKVSIDDKKIIEASNDSSISEIRQISSKLFYIKKNQGGGTGRAIFYIIDSNGKIVKEITADSNENEEQLLIKRDENGNIIKFVYYHNSCKKDKVDENTLEYDYENGKFGKLTTKTTDDNPSGMCD